MSSINDSRTLTTLIVLPIDLRLDSEPRTSYCRLETSRNLNDVAWSGHADSSTSILLRLVFILSRSTKPWSAATVRASRMLSTGRSPPWRQPIVFWRGPSGPIGSSALRGTGPRRRCPPAPGSYSSARGNMACGECAIHSMPSSGPAELRAGRLAAQLLLPLTGREVTNRLFLSAYSASGRP